MRPVVAVVPLVLSLTGCAAFLNGQIGDPGLENSVAALPKDPCSKARLAGDDARLSTFRNLKLSEALRAADPSDFEVGRQLIAGSAKEKSSADSEMIGKALGIDLEQFVPQLGNLDSTGVADAETALAAPAFSQVKNLGVLHGLGEEKPAPLILKRSQWMHQARLVAKTSVEDGWTASFAESLGRAGKTHEKLTQAELHALYEKGLIAAYMTAYFHNGAIFQLDLKQQPLKEKLVEKLKQKIADLAKLAGGGISGPELEAAQKAAEAELNAFLKDFEDKVCANGKTAGDNCVVFGVKDESTFVTRAGKSYGFPGITATIDPTSDKKISTNKINTDDIIVDLVRVVLEGLGDAATDVPGAKNSTLCAVTEKSLNNRCANDGNAEQVKDLKKVNDAGDRVEAGTTSIVGAAIRGGWLFSLNNETLARGITAGVAVSFRKFSEAVVWKVENGNTCPAIRADMPRYDNIAVSFVE